MPLHAFWHTLGQEQKSTVNHALWQEAPGSAGGAPTTFKNGCPAFTRCSAGRAACIPGLFRPKLHTVCKTGSVLLHADGQVSHNMKPASRKATMGNALLTSYLDALLHVIRSYVHHFAAS